MSNFSFRKLLTVLLILAVGWGIGIALTAQASAGPKYPAPTGEYSPESNPRSQILEDDGIVASTFREPAADSGSESDLTKIKIAIPELLTANLLNTCLPSTADYVELANQETELAAARSQRFAELWIGSNLQRIKTTALEDLHRQLQAAMSSKGKDGSVDYCDDAELIVYEWEGIQVTGDAAYAQFEGELQATRTDGGGTFASYRSQYQIQLVRGGSHGWRLLSVVDHSREPQG